MARNIERNDWIRVLDRVASPKAVLPTALATALMLHRRRGALRLALGTSLAVATEELLKRLVSRRRPKLFLRGRDRSFPSGHSAASTAYFIGLSLLAPRSLRTAALALAALASAGINVLRVEEREHWTTDTIAGDLVAAVSVGGAHMMLGALSGLRSRPSRAIPGSSRFRRTSTKS